MTLPEKGFSVTIIINLQDYTIVNLSVFEFSPSKRPHTQVHIH